MKIILNKRLVPTAESSNFLSPVQFCNRKGNTSLDTLLLKIITMDCLQLFQLNGAVLNNNAMACCNRMIPELTALHLQSLGISDDHYKHTPEYGKFCKGQGKASSPSNW
eukprot:1336952-Ditylum_brightwellii.AAC.1